ncbi:MAG: hypothetical protein U0K53_03190 [Paludibacteraceae bacterium]|nr:hypothetical protein [Paludibacteraceae bacterium]
MTCDYSQVLIAQWFGILVARGVNQGDAWRYPGVLLDGFKPRGVTME